MLQNALPTFGIKENIVIGIIAGGDKAIRNVVESAEDDMVSGWNDLKKYKVTKKDIVIDMHQAPPRMYRRIKWLQKTGNNNWPINFE